MGLLHVLQKVGTFCVHRIGKRENAIFANRNFFFLGLPSPIAITRRVVGNGDQVCFAFHFFL
jgi:hypothetical protein